MILAIDGSTGGIATREGVSPETLFNHRRSALRRSADETTFDQETVGRLARDRWDVAAIHIVVTGSDMSETGIRGSIRIARFVQGHGLPLSELYGIAGEVHDVEIGKTVIQPEWRGGTAAALLLAAAMDHVDRRMPQAERVYADPIIGTKRGIKIPTLQAMGFEIVAEPVVDQRYGFASQALCLRRENIVRFWRWYDERYREVPAISAIMDCGKRSRS